LNINLTLKNVRSVTDVPADPNGAHHQSRATFEVYTMTTDNKESNYV